MKQILFFVSLLFFFSLNIQAQTLEEANILFSKKKYMDAGDMYYQLYQFNKAAKAYQMQINVLMKSKNPLTEEVESIKPLLMQAEKAARMLSHCEDIQIIDSVIVDKNSFLKAYFTGEETGAFEQTGATVIYENQLKDRRYFGKKDGNGYFRLHSQAKIHEQWTDEKLLNLPDDSDSDDNFPFVMPDGLTVYYASTGNGSIGGYDLFISGYNMNNDTYLAPSQMGMPFNSIYNDYMLAIDEVNGIGYFASDRFQPEDKVVVYTFIPNDQFVPVNSEDEQELISRAQITSIRDSWLPNADYQSQLTAIRANIEKERHKTNNDFTFAINDNTVYHTLADFKNDTAKKSYLQSKDLEEKIQTMENQLNAQRKSFAEGGAGKKQSLRPPILSNEQQLETLYQTYEKTLVDTRNSEIKYLLTKK